MPEKLSSNDSIALSMVAHHALKSVGSGNSVAANGVTYASRLFRACADKKVLDYASVVRGPRPPPADWQIGGGGGKFAGVAVGATIGTALATISVEAIVMASTSGLPWAM